MRRSPHQGRTDSLRVFSLSPSSPPPLLYRVFLHVFSHHQKGSVQSGLVSIQAAAVFVRVGGVYPHGPQDHNALVAPFAVQPGWVSRQRWSVVSSETTKQRVLSGCHESKQIRARATFGRRLSCASRPLESSCFRLGFYRTTRVKCERPFARQQTERRVERGDPRRETAMHTAQRIFKCFW